MEKITKTEMLRSTMYKMFKHNHLPYLDMEDFVTMWQALADQWGIECSDWDEFTEEINSVASDRESVFNPIFNKYFNN